MKIVSIFFSVMLIFPIAFFLLHILELYDDKGTLKTFGVSEKLITSLAMPSFIFLAIYFSALLLSIFLNVKKKYVTNTIFLGIMIVSYIIITRLGQRWFV